MIKKERDINNLLILEIKNIVGGKIFMVTCKKCGANIPDNAAFCPGCGAPKPSEQPSAPETNQPAPMPKPQRQPKPPSSSSGGLQGIADTIFSKMIIMLGICIGLLLAWIGKIITIFTSGTAYQAGSVLVFTGLVGMGFVLLGGGLLNKNIDKTIKLGMIVAAGILIAFAMMQTFSFNIPDYTNMFSGYF